MLIGKKYKVESDANNIILMERHITGKDSKTPGSETWTVEGYFFDIKQALKFMADLELKKTELTDLITVAAKQDEIYALIKSLKDVVKA